MRAERKEALAGASSACAISRERLKNECQEARAAIRRRAREALDVLDRESARARADARANARADKSAKARERERKQARDRIAAVRESDDDVRQNLPPRLLRVWEKHKRGIKGDARRTRTEAFLDWVEENADEVAAELADDEPSDDEHAESLRRYYEEAS